MTLSTEAAYMYSYSKEIERVHKELHTLSKKIEHHAQKHAKATKEKHKVKHKKKHYESSTKIKKLIERQKHLFKELHHHLIKFHHSMREQGKKL